MRTELLGVARLGDNLKAGAVAPRAAHFDFDSLFALADVSAA